MNTLRHFTKYHLCKRCLKELPVSPENTAATGQAAVPATQQYPEATHLTLVEQIEQTKQHEAEQLCTSCQALAQLQDNWKPFPLGASIGAIFFVPDKSEAKED